jgi:TM2 domain-containing membrane protein YozV
MESEAISRKSRLAAALLCFLLALLFVHGAHRFYLKKTGTAILMLLTLGGLWIWTLVDLIFILTGSFRDKEGKRVYHWTEPPPA